MDVSLRTKSAWVEKSLHQNQTALVSLTGGDGATVKVPRDFLVASSKFLQNLLHPSCPTCLDSNTMFLPSAQSSSLELFSQILVKSETVSLSGNVIGNMLDSVKDVLKLLGCDMQLEVSISNRTRSVGDLQVSGVSLSVDLADSDIIKMEQVYEENFQEEMVEQATQEDIVCRAFQEHVIVLPPSQRFLDEVVRSVTSPDTDSCPLIKETVLSIEEVDIRNNESQQLIEVKEEETTKVYEIDVIIETIKKMKRKAKAGPASKVKRPRSVSPGLERGERNSGDEPGSKKGRSKQIESDDENIPEVKESSEHEEEESSEHEEEESSEHEEEESSENEEEESCGRKSSGRIARNLVATQPTSEDVESLKTANIKTAYVKLGYNEIILSVDELIIRDDESEQMEEVKEKETIKEYEIDDEDDQLEKTVALSESEDEEEEDDDDGQCTHYNEERRILVFNIDIAESHSNCKSFFSKFCHVEHVKRIKARKNSLGDTLKYKGVYLITFDSVKAAEEFLSSEILFNDELLFTTKLRQYKRENFLQRRIQRCKVIENKHQRDMIQLVDVNRSGILDNFVSEQTSSEDDRTVNTDSEEEIPTTKGDGDDLEEVDIEVVSATEYVDVHEVLCRRAVGEFHLSKFISGGNGESVYYNGSWMTPSAFEREAGSRSKKYKSSLFVNNKPIIKLLDEKGISTLCKRQSRNTRIIESDDEYIPEVKEASENDVEESCGTRSSGRTASNFNAIQRTSEDVETIKIKTSYVKLEKLLFKTKALSPAVLEPITKLEQTQATVAQGNIIGEKAEDLVKTPLDTVVKKLKKRKSIKMKCFSRGNLDSDGRITGMNNNLQTRLNEALLDGNKVLKYVEYPPPFNNFATKTTDKKGGVSAAPAPGTVPAGCITLTTFLRDHEILQQFRQNHNIDMFSTMLQQVGQRNPQLLQIILQNHEVFLKMIDEGKAGEEGESGIPGLPGEELGVIQVSNDDRFNP